MQSRFTAPLGDTGRGVHITTISHGRGQNTRENAAYIPHLLQVNFVPRYAAEDTF